MRIFWYTVKVAINNSFVVMKEVNGDIMAKPFCLQLADELINQHCSRKEKGRKRSFNEERYKRTTLSRVQYK